MRKLITIALICFQLVAYSQKMQVNMVQQVNFNEIGGRVNCIFQDRIGFIWVGKETGLYRFDGYELVVYRNNPSDSTTLSGNTVQTIVEDFNGNLLIGTRGGGLSHFHHSTGKFTRYMHSQNNTNSISHNEINSIIADKKGFFWVGSDGGGLNIFDPATAKFQRFAAGENEIPGLKSNKILHFSPASNGMIWLSTWGNGLYLFDPTHKKAQHIGSNTPYAKGKFICTKEVTPGILWIGTYDYGLLEYNIKLDKFRTIVPNNSSNSFKDIQTTAKGEIFVASYGGLLYFPSVTSNYSVIEGKQYKPVTTTNIFIDRNKTVWVGYGSGSVGKISPIRKPFNTFPATNPYSKLPVHSITTGNTKGEVLFSSNSEMVEYNVNSERTRCYQIPYLQGLSIVKQNPPNSIVCSGVKGLMLINRNTGLVTALPLDKTSKAYLAQQQIMSIYHAGGSDFWVAADSAAYLLSHYPSHKYWKISKIYPIGAEKGISKCHYISCFLQHPNGSFWVGTWGGGISVKLAGKQWFTTIMHEPGNKNSLSNNFIECMASDSKGNVWVGTKGGLNRIDINTLLTTNLKVSNDLADERIAAIAAGYKNKVWVSSRQGITSITDDLKTIQNYGLDDGVPSKEFMSRSVTTDSAGNIYFGTQRGLVWFNPDSIVDNPNLADAVITGFTINDTPANYSEPLPDESGNKSLQEISLTNKQNNFSFKLAALSYFNPAKNKIQYLLEGFDKEWQNPGTDRTAKYLSVPAGVYTLRVKAANEDGVWNPREKQLKIVISPPLWLSPIAIVLYFVIFTAAAFFTFYKIKQIKQPILLTKEPLPGKNIAYNTIQPSMVSPESIDQKFYANALKIVEENMADPDFGVYQLADKMNVSRTNIYRKINSVTGLSIAEFIKVVRLKRAEQLLVQKMGSISDIAFKVGFKDPKYFSKCFKQHFGVAPAQYVNEKPNAKNDEA